MCKYFGISRTAYYKAKNRTTRVFLEEDLVLSLVYEIRRQQPRVGGKKLYLHLKEDLQQVGKIGRDRLFSILRNNNLLVSRKKSYMNNRIFT